MAVGRPGDGIDKLAVAGVDAQGLAGAGIPDLYGVIPTAGRDELPVGRPGHRIYIVDMACIRENGRSHGMISQPAGGLYAKDEQQGQDKRRDERDGQGALKSRGPATSRMLPVR